MTFRPGWAGLDSSRAIIVEDILTTGGSIQEVIEALKQREAAVAGICVLVDRTAGQGKPVESLLALKVEAFESDACPLCKSGVPLLKPGTSDKKA